MLFEHSFHTLQILDVIRIDQKDVRIANHGRNFNALSYRFSSDACLKTSARDYHAKDGSVFFVPHNLDYHRTATRDHMIVIHFNMIGYSQRSIEVFTPQEPAVLQALFEEILTCWQKKGSGYRYRCCGLLYEIFAICHAQANPGHTPSKIAKGIDYIYANWHDPDLTVSQAAGQANVSEVYFRRLFYREHGTTPRQFIIDLRLQNAVSLMDTGYFTLQEIAAQCGYADYKYFSVEFKRHKGCSPSEYIYRFNNA